MSLQQKSRTVSSLLLPSIFSYFALTNYYYSLPIINSLDPASNLSIVITILLVGSTFFIPKLIAKSVYKNKLYSKEAFNTAILIGIIGGLIALTGKLPFDRKSPKEWSAIYFNLLLVINLVQVHKYLKKHGYDKVERLSA